MFRLGAYELLRITRVGPLALPLPVVASKAQESQTRSNINFVYSTSRVTEGAQHLFVSELTDGEEGLQRIASGSNGAVEGKKANTGTVEAVVVIPRGSTATGNTSFHDATGCASAARTAWKVRTTRTNCSFVNKGGAASYVPIADSARAAFLQDMKSPNLRIKAA